MLRGSSAGLRHVGLTRPWEGKEEGGGGLSEGASSTPLLGAHAGRHGINQNEGPYQFEGPAAAPTPPTLLRLPHNQYPKEGCQSPLSQLGTEDTRAG
jgi:hypothetical protein